MKHISGTDRRIYRRWEFKDIMPSIATYMTLLTFLNISAFGKNLDAISKLHSIDTVLLSSPIRKSPFVVSANFNQTALDFKGGDGTSNVASSPQIGRLNGGDNKDLYSAVIPHKIEKLSSMYKSQAFRYSQAERQRTISRIFRNTGSKKFDKNCKECNDEGNIKETDKDWDSTWLPSQHENARRKSTHTIVRRSTANALSKNHNVGSVSRERRMAKMQESKLSRNGRSLRSCPVLSVARKVIFHCSKGRKVGSKCSLSCDSGFVLAGKRKSRRCRRPKRKRNHFYFDSRPYWTGKQEDFQCVPVCKHLDVPDNGDRTCKMVDLPGGKALRCTTKCNRGYKLIGTLINTCMENGKWSGQPATCKAASTRQTQSLRFDFREHQTLPCGEVYGLASFRKDGIVYLVAGDKNRNEINIFRWTGDNFSNIPHQTFPFLSPEFVEVLTAPSGRIWLIVGGTGPVTMFKLGADGRFQRSHTTPLFGHKPMPADTIGFAELGGVFYRCYGRNRRDIPVIVVHKLRDKRNRGDGDVFTRITRKKLPGEHVHQCSMYTEGDSLYAVATLRKPNGQGRIIIGHLTKKRMKIVDVIEGNNLREVSDSLGLKIGAQRYIVVSQADVNGKCLVYKRHWWTRLKETG